MSAIVTSFPGASFAAVPSAPRTHLRITRRGRVVLSALVALPLIAGAAGLALNGGAAAASDDQHAVTFSHVTVQQGDTLWSVAQEVAPQADPREVVQQLMDLNQLTGPQVQAGEDLLIPSQYAR